MKREQKIERVIRLVWSSLDSHLPYTHDIKNPKERIYCGTTKFHKKCVREYAEMIKLLSELL